MTRSWSGAWKETTPVVAEPGKPYRVRLPVRGECGEHGQLVCRPLGRQAVRPDQFGEVEPVVAVVRADRTRAQSRGRARVADLVVGVDSGAASMAEVRLPVDSSCLSSWLSWNWYTAMVVATPMTTQTTASSPTSAATSRVRNDQPATQRRWAAGSVGGLEDITRPRRVWIHRQRGPGLGRRTSSTPAADDATGVSKDFPRGATAVSRLPARGSGGRPRSSSGPTGQTRSTGTTSSPYCSPHRIRRPARP